jgi:RES domain-containing protein
MAREPRPKSIDIARIYYRYSSYDVPFWVRPNTTDERWHKSGDGPTQYLSATPDGAWAELIRNENLRSEADLQLVQMPLWQASVEQGRIANYGDFALAEEAGFSPEALVDDDQTRCQEEGQRLRKSGVAGVLYPSAALPGEQNLVLFGPRILLPWGSSRRLASGIPANKLTVGAPPRDLLPRVRHVGARHAGYTEYRRVRQRETGRRPAR